MSLSLGFVYSSEDITQRAVKPLTPFDVNLKTIDELPSCRIKRDYDYFVEDWDCAWIAVSVKS